jgi:ferric-dicitrate binding protein FerR (iron transport regulator)
MKTLIVVPIGSELVVSFKGKSAIRLEENSRLVIGPPENNLQMIDLRKGTISAYLNPKRDPLSSPRFGIRTRSGVIEAKGTFYALTVYKGQTYTAVKHGEIKKESTTPSKLDFAAYVKKSPSKNPLKPAEKNNSN